jgi:hypothetical protein
MGVASSSSHIRTAPGLIAGTVLDVYARRYDDPVDRLRFLRKATIRWNTGTRRWKHVALVASVGLVLLVLPLSSITNARDLLRHAPPPELVKPSAVAKAAAADVWLVEKKDDYEVYSNGLRVETRGAQFHSERRFRALDRKNPESWTAVRTDQSELQNRPAGIVFHTTESHTAPFDESHNDRLRMLARGVLSYVRAIKAYHYLIDRFGRVYRVVSEESIANHAGNSIWADSSNVYMNLNSSFLGIAFEAQTRPQDGAETISRAQEHSGRILTDMLRAKYNLRPENCVTHAQVSVNPDNFFIGAHTDWASGFPYTAMGLPDNYAVPSPSMTIFGFSYDNSYVQLSEARLWKGLLLAQEEQRQGASVRAAGVAGYRAELRQRYRKLHQALKLTQQQAKEDLE